MIVELTNEQEQFIEQELAAGHFTDKGEVIAEALALLKRQGEAHAKIRASVQQGLDDLNTGRYRTISTSEEAQTLAADIKLQARELKVQREHKAH